MSWLFFFIGLFLGALIGYFCCALMVATRAHEPLENDEREELRE